MYDQQILFFIESADYQRKAGKNMRAHIIEAENNVVAFFPDSYRFFEINDFTKDLITHLIDGEPEGIFTKKYNISLENYKEYTQSIFTVSVMEECNEPKKIIKISNGNRTLHRLVLNVSNNCNLKCKYCYANGGNYLSEEKLMDENLAIKALDRFYGYFEDIELIQIFGGEPFLNIPVIESIINYVENLKNGNDKIKTRIGFVTNGTILDEHILDLIEKHNLTVTLSLDGPPKVNDQMRVFANGQGISEVVEKNIKLMKERTGQPSTIEATYHQGHVDQGIEVSDIVKYMQDNFQTRVHIAPVNGSEEREFMLKDFSSFVRSAKTVFETIFTDQSLNYSLVNRIINSINSKQDVSYICTAGFNTISVSVNGDVYPCFMFTDINKFLMGNVEDENLFKCKNYLNILQEFLELKKTKLDQCKDCFINNFCSGCLGLNYLQTNELAKTPEEHCEMRRKLAEQVILEIAKINKDPEKKLEFDNLFKEVNNKCENNS